MTEAWREDDPEAEEADAPFEALIDTADGEPADFAFRRSDTFLFEGDTGTLTFPARRALVAVIKRSYLFGEQNPDLWDALIENRYEIESRLNDLFLELVLDAEVGIAYKVEAHAAFGGSSFPKVLTTQNRGYTWTETILLRHLRELYTNDIGREGSTQVVISREEMIERLRSDVSSRRNDDTSQRKAAEAAFDAIRAAAILLPTDGAKGDRFRISPVIVPLMPLAKLQEIVEFLDQMAAGDGVNPADAEADDDGEADGGGLTAEDEGSAQ